MTPTPATLRTAGAAALLSVLVLAGCSEEEPLPQPPATSAPTAQEPTTQAPDDESATTSPVDDADVTTAPADDEGATQTAEPGPDPELSATDGSFTIELPDGWEDAYELAEQEGVLLAAKEIERKDEFFTNVVVTQEEYVSNLTTAVEEAAAELAGEDGEYELLEPAPVDGNRAPGYTLVRDVQGSTIHQTQRWISHDGTLYVVTFSAIDSQAEEAAGALDEILSSWSWQD
ncbi:hypothetical protein [Ornithinimicrobium sufpigmenti]|uniref:hypothetical protein n=1 Tax=Ornithinimicrobium sufpigmenti TaxID=2508882 RepID=UPI0010360E8F|nr:MULTISPECIES: hypothetical protein [unclassified Ornithinimicrobium]